VYLRGLLMEGERKSIEPLASRVSLPAALGPVADPEQALQQFVNQSSWDEAAVAREYRAAMAEALAEPDGVFLIDDTSFPKAGRHSVGVQRQYCGALGKKANCQCAVSVHYAASNGHAPLAMRLFLPTAWQEDPARLDQAGVPDAERRALGKGQIALELLDQVRAEGWPGQVVVADCGYGVSEPFREAVAARGLHYVVGVTERMVVFTEPPQWQQPDLSAVRTRSRPRTRARLTDASPQAFTLAEVAARTPLRRVTWRAGTKRRLSARFGWVRVRVGLGLGQRPVCRRNAPLALDRATRRRLVALRVQQPAGHGALRARRAALAPALDGRTRLPADERGARPGPFRGPLLARLSPPRHAGDAGLRLLDSRNACGRRPCSRRRRAPKKKRGAPRAAADPAGGAPGAPAAVAVALPPTMPVLSNPCGNSCLTE
jgi:SRSO17 transposase